MSLADYQTRTMGLTRDDAGKLSSSDRDDAIAAAVSRYGQDRPRQRVDDVTAATANLLPLPAQWQADYSLIVALEHPVGAVPPTLLGPERYGMYRDATQADKIMLLDAVAVGATVRCTYTIRHVLDASSDTIRVEDREAVCCWAAALLCDQLSSLYSNSGDSTIQVDSVDHTSRARDYASRAKTLRQRYYDALGIDPKKNVAAGTTVNWDAYDSRGRDRLTHPKRYR